MERKEFCEQLTTEMNKLMSGARESDELSFLFAILGINSGIEDAGWQPIFETQALFRDLVGLLNAPLNDEARARIGLLLYCHITEANYIYHVIYNLLLTVEHQQPKIFNFLDKYKNGIPPSVAIKISKIKKKLGKHGYFGLITVFDELNRPDIRNAFYHSDYVLFEGEMRLKHRGSQIKKIPLSDIFQLIEKTTDFFNLMTKAIIDARQSFPKDYKITGRKSPQGQPLSSMNVIVDEYGVAVGFSTSDPLPMW